MPKIGRDGTDVTSREGRVSRNVTQNEAEQKSHVTSREGRVSRNFRIRKKRNGSQVTSREGRVSRNNSKEEP